MPALAIFLIILGLYALPACLTTIGSHRRGNVVRLCVLEGLVWPFTWIQWFVMDNRAAGRRPFKGH